MVIAPISRNHVLLRAKYGWERKTVPFHQMVIHQPSGYRTDAAGYISMCYDIPLDAPHSLNGMTVVTLYTDGWFYEIPRHELKAGDALGYLGPGSVDPDGGTIVVFEKWLNDDPGLGVAVTWEHLPSVGIGPDQRARSLTPKWHAYRYKHLEE